MIGTTLTIVATVAVTLFIRKKFANAFSDKDVLDAKLEVIKDAYEDRDKKLTEKCLKTQQQINRMELQKRIASREALSCQFKALKIQNL